MSKSGKNKNHICYLAATSCEHRRRNDKLIFVGSINERETPRAAHNRYAEQFFPQGWADDSGNDLSRRCS
jgi:hypothetical protein